MILLADLTRHRPPLVGLVCPRCGGQVYRDLERSACLQCGHEPPTRRPAPPILERGNPGDPRHYRTRSPRAINPNSATTLL